jgi:hypothetical protein
VEDFDDATVSPRSHGSLQSDITQSTQELGEGSGGQGAEDDERQVFSSSAQVSSSSAQPVSEPSQSPPRAAPEYLEGSNEESDENGNQDESDSAEPSAAAVLALTPVEQQHTPEQEQDNALGKHGGAEADCSSSRTPSSVADKGEEVEARALLVVSHVGTSSSVASQASAGVGAVADSAPAGLDGSNGYGAVDG